VVATRVPGHVDLIEAGRSGVLVPPGDPDALARAIDELLRDTAARERLGEAARARVERDFSADRMAAQTAEVYRAALARHPRPVSIPGV
jgi:glycosyltransferase involved in cell wall biosynthesis